MSMLPGRIKSGIVSLPLLKKGDYSDSPDEEGHRQSQIRQVPGFAYRIQSAFSIDTFRESMNELLELPIEI